MAPTYSNGQEMVSIYLIKIKITTKFFKFDLVTEEKRRSRYVGDVARIGRVTNFQLRCKSQITSLITSATKLISHQNFSTKYQYLAYLQTKKCAPTTWAMEPGQAAA